MMESDIFKGLVSNKRKVYSGYVMNRDVKVVRIEKNESVKVIDPSLSPLFFRRSRDFEIWVVSRMIDGHRTNSRILRKMLRLKNPESLEVAMYSHCRTITDDFWFKEDGSNLTFKDLVFKDDRLKDVALLGKFNSLEVDGEILTPELTNIGSFEKCWKVDEQGKWHLLKIANWKEMFSEVFVSRLCDYLNYPSVQYNRVKDLNVVECINFVEEGYWYEPMFSLIEENEDYEDNYNILNRLDNLNGTNLVKEYLQILFVDALVQNLDRHTFNYGLIVKEGKIIKMAQNFDNNLALISKSPIITMPSLINPLIGDFIYLVKCNKLQFEIPVIARDSIGDLVDLTIKEVSVDILEDVKIKIINLVWNNYNLIKEALK